MSARAAFHNVTAAGTAAGAVLAPVHPDLRAAPHRFIGRAV